MRRLSLFALLLVGVDQVVCASYTKWIGEIKKIDGADYEYQCKCYSDHSCWPTGRDWDRLNKTVAGRLQVAIPPGAVCHRHFENTTSVYDAAKCADTQANWSSEQWM